MRARARSHQSRALRVERAKYAVDRCRRRVEAQHPHRLCKLMTRHSAVAGAVPRDEEVLDPAPALLERGAQLLLHRLAGQLEVLETAAFAQAPVDIKLAKVPQLRRHRLGSSGWREAALRHLAQLKPDAGLRGGAVRLTQVLAKLSVRDGARVVGVELGVERGHRLGRSIEA